MDQWQKSGKNLASHTVTITETLLTNKCKNTCIHTYTRPTSITIY